MKLKRLQTLDFIQRFSRQLETDFEKNLFNSCLRNYASHGNPLRFHNFAFVFRELMNHIIARKAPLTKVMEAPWYKKVSEVRDVTRKQQLKYCAQYKLSDEYLGEEFLEILDESLKEMEAGYVYLNKHTHITEKYLTPSPVDFFNTARDIIQTATQILEAIEDCKDEIISILKDKIHDAVDDMATSSLPDELSIIANHSNIEYASVEDFEIESFDDEFINIHASGTVSVTQEYGPSNDALVLDEEYPFSVRMRSRLDSPETLEILSKDLEVDTSSWFGEEEENDDHEITGQSQRQAISPLHNFYGLDENTPF